MSKSKGSENEQTSPAGDGSSAQGDGGELTPPSSNPVLAFFRQWRVLRNAPGRLEAALLGFTFIALFGLVWYLLTMGTGDQRVLGRIILPSPAETFSTFPSLWFDRALSQSAVASLARVLSGFAMAVVISVPLGVISGSYWRVNAFLRPISVFGRSIPIAALIPLTLVWFGYGELNKVMFIFLAAAAFVLFDSTSAVQAVPARYLDTAYTLGAHTQGKKAVGRALMVGVLYALVFSLGWWVMLYFDGSLDASEGLPSGIGVMALVGLSLGTLLWYPILNHQAISRVLMPLAMPDIVNSLRLLFGLAFGYIMLAEVIDAKRGLGSIIITSQRQGPREHIYLILIIISLLAFGIDRLILTIQKRAFPYVKNGQA